MKDILRTALSAFIFLIFAFFCHRAFTWSALTPDTGFTMLSVLQAASVGAMSDVWIAFLGSLIILIMGTLRLHTLILQFLIIFVSIASSLHQVYVDFFRFQIMPFHLGYMADLDFIQANSDSLSSWIVWINLLMTLALGASLWRWRLFYELRLSKLISIYAAVALISVFCHNRNIVLRMRWFVPETLQLNFFERLYVNLLTTRLPKPLLPDESEYLRHAISPQEPEFSAESVLRHNIPNDDEFDELGKALREAFVRARNSNKKPMVLAVILESLRPSDTGYFSSSKESLTPNLDAVSRRSITFLNAYSTGSVTRGAQEAIFCGYPGSRETSLMRGRAIVSARCLPELLSQAQNVKTFWYHGGEGRFDSQSEFWKSHGVNQIVAQSDFPNTDPRTDWGISDLAFLTDAAKRIHKLKLTMNEDAALGMLLTVTNHIPWQIPSDTPMAIDQLKKRSDHPSRATVAYTDFALGKFIADLKTQGIWDDAMIVIVSDHGNSVVPYSDIYNGDPSSIYRLQSHINLILTGGIVHEVLADRQIHSIVRKELVSQADINGFFAYLFELKNSRFFGEALFLKKRRSPILSDIEQGLFNPKTGAFFTNLEVTEINLTDQPESERFGLLYFRAFLRYILQQDVTENRVIKVN